jgi:hypothetical protein
MPDNAGFVYLIQAGHDTRFKIGCTTDVPRRLGSLQTSAPVRLHLLGVKRARDMYDEEKRWHAEFAASRALGEWFDLDEQQFLRIAKALRAKYGINPRERIAEPLEIGSHYFISLDGRSTIDVQLVELNRYPDSDRPAEAKVKEVSGWQTWNVYPDEVRSTRIGALLNFMFLLGSPIVRGAADA